MNETMLCLCKETHGELSLKMEEIKGMGLTADFLAK